MNTSETMEVVQTMNGLHFSAFDYSVFGALLAVSLSIGLYFGFFSKQEQTTEEYLQGGHKMKPLPIAISLVASQLSAIAVVAIPAEVYSYGWQYALLFPALICITACANYLFIPVFYHNNIDNCYAYLEMRFGKAVRILITATYLSVGVVFLPLVLYIPSLAFVEVTGHNLYVVNGVVCSVCVFYTMIGGIKAVVWTDVVQAFVMVASIVVVAYVGIVKTGGLGVVWSRAVEGGRIFPPIMTMDLTTRQTFWNMFFGLFVMWNCHVTFTQSCVQRIVSLPKLAYSRQALILFCCGVIFIMFFTSFTGIIMFAYYYGCDPLEAKIVSKADKLVPHFVEDVAGHIVGMSGVFISCVFSASLSTVSANLNSYAGIVYMDLIKPRRWYRHTERKANTIMKAIVLILGIECALGALIVEKFSSIYELVNILAGTITGAVFGVFTLAMLNPWANRHGALYGAIISMVTVGLIIANTQIAIGNKHLKYEAIPASTEWCTNETIANAAKLLDISDSTMVPQSTDDGFAFYKISFMWYGPIGTAITWICCIIISYLTGGQDLNELNLNLLAPCVQQLLPRKYRHTQLHVVHEKPVADVTINDATNDSITEKLTTTEWVWKNDEKKS